jgi:pimeloyl-ACP methyl ester carboxylesterase
MRIPAVVAACAVVAAINLDAQSLTDRSIAVSGTTVHVRCGGTRAAGPMVLLESGAGAGADSWLPVQASIAEFVRVCAYDRPGTKGSGPHPAGVNAAQYPAFLLQVMREAGEAPPYVLVGHSFGGLIVSLIAATHPSEVSGIVLVDSSHEDQMQRMAAVTGPPPPPPATPPPGAAPPPPAGVRFPDFADAVRATRFRHDLPLIVLTAARPMPDPEWTKIAPLWSEMQRELASRSTKSSHVVLDNAGHFIQRDAPDAVVDAIRKVVADARATR